MAGLNNACALWNFFSSPINVLIKGYETLVLSHFDYSQVFIRSSDIDRTLISAYSNLAGLFGNEQGRSPLVPVHAPVKYSLDAVSG